MLNDRPDGLLVLVEGGLAAALIGIGRGLWKSLPTSFFLFALTVSNLDVGLLFPIVAGVILFNVTSSFFFLGFCVDLRVLVWKKDRLFPMLFVRYLLANAVVLSLNALLSRLLSAAIAVDAQGRAFAALGSIGICIIWVPYFRTSPRVQATFIR
jgi:hypothetical protein